MSYEWFELPSTKITIHEVKVAVRAWEPGDGLMCRNSGFAKRIPCGAPVAVVREEKDDLRYPGRDRERVSISLYCSQHISDIVRRQVGDSDWRGTGSTQKSVRKAEETIIAAHWDEYQTALEQIVTEQKDRYLSFLPEWLRAGFTSAEEVSS